MNRKEFNIYLEHVLARTKDVLGAKGDEYSYNGGAFENFEEGVGLGFSNSREAVAWGYAVKHIQSVLAMLSKVEVGDSTHLSDKLIEEKCGDVINYMILIEAMLKERVDNNKKLEEWSKQMQLNM